MFGIHRLAKTVRKIKERPPDPSLFDLGGGLLFKKKAPTTPIHRHCGQPFCASVRLVGERCNRKHQQTLSSVYPQRRIICRLYRAGNQADTVSSQRPIKNTHSWTNKHLPKPKENARLHFYQDKNAIWLHFYQDNVAIPLKRIHKREKPHLTFFSGAVYSPKPIAVITFVRSVRLSGHRKGRWQPWLRRWGRRAALRRHRGDRVP